MAKTYEYVVLVSRKTEHTGVFTVVSYLSKTKLTRDEAIERAQELAFQDEEPDAGWEEADTRYDEDCEVQEGELKDE